MSAKIHPSYTAMSNQGYCCVPACIQMVFRRRDFPCLNQEEIGIDLGLRVPKEEAKYFKNVPTGRQPSAGWGTQINLKKYDLNNFFKKRKIPLASIYHALDDLDNVPEFIADNITQGNDIMTCFRYGALYNEDIPYGHAALIEEIDGNNLALVDPGSSPKRKRVSIEDLVKAIEVHRNRDVLLGGFWLIS